MSCTLNMRFMYVMPHEDNFYKDIQGEKKKSTKQYDPAARHLLGPPYLPREEDGGAHHTHKTWLPFKTKTSRGPARAGAHLRTTW